jgi:quinol monooxygenase YgiN
MKNLFLDFSILLVGLLLYAATSRSVVVVALTMSPPSPSSTTAVTDTVRTAYGINTQFDVKSEYKSQFISLLKMNGLSTLQNEPGAVQFVLGQDTDKVNRFHLHEQYESKDSYQQHQKMDHTIKVLDFFKTTPGIFCQDPVIETFCGTHLPIKVPTRYAFCLNVKLCINPEVREEFLHVIYNNQKGSHLEPLCLQYDFGESDTVPNTFHFHEQYTGTNDGKEGFDAHAATPHFAAWEVFASRGSSGSTTVQQFTSPPVVSFYKSIALLAEDESN